ncbi:dicarboxylate/amino acid:cation symporter [Georgenia thermotolerans]|uniref:Cation:dicarboxylase symporter family transporter n=1 Tax=Georgenia thermotolerans TaxID=527326 RepID=A0A7J5UNQ9_9MICO|nr:dicarboxylate/amino acid:cation symporter [Georgenia thermotolerans]KAE8763533.1 cation:dicarboxylase symporter family transporter [Georgenia thermotolerans]
MPSFSVQILLGLALGVVLGWAALSLGKTADGADNWLTVTLSTIGSSFVSLLKAVVPPLVFTAIVASIANLRGLTNGARLAGQTLLWFAITSLVAVAIGIGLGLVLQPGANAGVDAADAAAPSKTGTWLDFLQGLIPANFLGLGASSSLETGADGAVTAVSTGVSFNVLQIIVIALVVGLAALKVGKKADPFLTLNASVLTVIQKVLWWIIRLAPLGTLGLVGRAIATYGWSSLANLGTFAVAIYVGLALVLFVVYPVLLKGHGLPVMSYFRGAWPAIQLAFVSRSSIGTMPVTERVTHRNLGVPRAYAAFAVPFGSTTKMDGCAAIYPAVAAIFVAQFFGVDLSVTDYLLIAFVSVVGSAATAGLTGATVMLTLTLSTLGLPLEGVGLLLAIDPILDMGRTAVNVAGQVLVPIVVSKREGILDVEKYRGADAEDLFTEDEADGVVDGDVVAREPELAASR